MKPLTTLLNRRRLSVLALALTMILVGTAGLGQPSDQALAQQAPSSHAGKTLYMAIVLNHHPPPPSPPTSGDWLENLNYYRALARLPEVAENPAWSHGDWLHSRYMVVNDYIGRYEDPNNPAYTPEGDAAAQASNLMVSSNPSTPDEAAIMRWILGPFHALGILDPGLQEVGFGSYREPIGTWQMGSALDVLRGQGDVPASQPFPVTWPAGGMSIPLAAYLGGESPDPLKGCPGYSVPTGLPILLQVGPGDLVPNVTAHSFRQNGVPMAHCVFDETSYSNPNAAHQQLARSVLDARDAVVVIPRQPLIAGQKYTVSVTVSGQTYTWSFTVADDLSDGSLAAQSILP